MLKADGAGTQTVWPDKTILQVLGYKSSQNIVDHLGYLEKHHSPNEKTVVTTFWLTFGKSLATFDYDILSHCTKGRERVFACEWDDI